MTESDYRQTQAYAQSDLCELKRILSGKPAALNVKPETLLFGTAFHASSLADRLNYVDPTVHFTGIDAWLVDDLLRMEMALFEHEQGALFTLIHGERSEREVSRFWTDPLTGLPCKCRIDAVPNRKHLIDLKTTSRTTRQAFIDSLTTYDYDLQAAHYLSSDPDNARYFEFIGVQKTAPYSVWRVPYHLDSDLVQGGLVKRNRLLAAAKREKEGGGWAPSSWSRNQEQAV